MTKLLEEALSRLTQLSNEEQDQIAALILEEIESERNWDEAFSKSRNQLAHLAGEAFEEYERGETRPCD